MSLSKKEQVIQAERRAAVIAEITARGALTGNELKASLGIGNGVLPAMIKASVLESKFSGMVDDNGNRIMLYALPGKECKRIEVERGPTLFELWPVSVPQGVPRKPVAERHPQCGLRSSYGVAIQSSMIHLAMMCG